MSTQKRKQARSAYLRVVLPTLGDHRPDGPVHEAGDQYLVVVSSAVAAVEGAHRLSNGTIASEVVHTQRCEVDRLRVPLDAHYYCRKTRYEIQRLDGYWLAPSRACASTPTCGVQHGVCHPGRYGPTGLAPDFTRFKTHRFTPNLKFYLMAAVLRLYLEVAITGAAAAVVSPR